jgi:hypothetical protein
MQSPKEIKGLKFTSRKETMTDSTPGSYVITETVPSRFGYITREERMKTTDHEGSLGPGYYEVNSSSFKRRGSAFSKQGREQYDVQGEDIPGPGHYHTESSSPKQTYSIPKASMSSSSKRPQRLGPGSYEVSRPTLPQGPSFSMTPRFNMKSFDQAEGKLYPAFLSSTTNPTAQHILRRNLDISDHRPGSKSIRIRKQADLSQAKREVVKKNYSCIQESTQQGLRQALDQKFRRLSYRTHIGEVQVVGNCWLKVSAVIGCAYVCRCICDNKAVRDTQALRKRSEKQLRWLMVFSLAFGKMSLAVKRIRLERTARVRGSSDATETHQTHCEMAGTNQGEEDQFSRRTHRAQPDSLSDVPRNRWLAYESKANSALQSPANPQAVYIRTEGNLWQTPD